MLAHTDPGLDLVDGAGRRSHTSVSLRVIVEQTDFLDGVLVRLGERRWPSLPAFRAAA